MTGAYDGKLYQGEAYAFPVFGTVVKDDMTAADFYRCGAPMDRTYEQYEEAFGLPLEVFMGRRILDLGAGVRATFAAQAADHGIDVISVCPNWADTNYRSDLHNNSVW